MVVISDSDTGHFSSSRRRRGYLAFVGVPTRLLLSHCPAVTFFSFEFIERIGTPFRKADESFSDFGCQLSGDYFNRSGIVDVASLYSRRCYIIVGRCTVYFYQCRMCNRAGTC